MAAIAQEKSKDLTNALDSLKTDLTNKNKGKQYLH